jgi:hypothetical protein
MLGALSLERTKTFNGRIERGVDFLGYNPVGPAVAKWMITNFFEKASQL